MRKTKFYNCSTESSGAAFWAISVPVTILGCCSTHNRAQKNSDFAVTSTDSLFCNSTFLRQNAAKDGSSGSIYGEAEYAHISAMNLTLPDADTECAIMLEFTTSRIRYLNFVHWKSAVACKFFMKPSTSEQNLIRNLAFANITTDTGLIGVKGTKLEFQVICISGCSFPTAFVDFSTSEKSIITVSNSMLDQKDVNQSIVNLDTPSYNRSMTFISVEIGFGPRCYNTPPPLTPEKQNLLPYFIASGVFLFVIICASIYFIVCHVKKSSAYEETSTLQTYRLKDKFGEALITS
ncbi:hypothetical protein TVAG_496020 [Trichomonas vaginalis G3]|uniref:Uncharacterized protein n=1 Tax=Trichomonas vaginalis (strain ATCC PRA-98 / G3) TaxID=412133 RepID=A2DVP1_TRIV3|nr:hypothetical protein TVAGG3_0276160 [Trichomonas vaginalis G3]EAY15583.1 hypothetical protein TVAG_496020 [Trichomonas vaginalis G3]KAI5526229.1 hypothetical protein TVAGG3_0276160 [Trichomonas vaginalis G3]|eukprot:XP_001327806.1 hypothetical protein [Trichomonas vaginalis G3]